MNKYGICLFFISLITAVLYGQKPLPGAHAHNDYNHEQPLLDALAHGFTSIEVDILLIGGEIYVAHDFPENGSSLPTLDKLYLQPLDSVFKNNGGMLYPGYDKTCYLMIDIKTDAEETYLLLNKKLRPYQSWIRHSKNQDPEGKITVFISGNRPIQTVIKDEQRLVSLDGRPEDLGKGYDTEIMPIISQSYNLYSEWKGEGEMPGSDREKIRSLAEKVHQEGKKLRLWGYADNPNIWDTLLELGVDIINADNLDMLQDYFSQKEKEKK